MFLFCRRIGNELKILLKETLEQDSVRKATTAWWGMLALISILNDMTGEELEFEYVMALLPRISLRFVNSFIHSLIDSSIGLHVEGSVKFSQCMG